MTETYIQNDNLLLNLNYSIHNFKRLIYNCFSENDIFAVCLININKFKYYNYRFGYEFGDMLLQIILDKVKKTIDDDGYICRYGGDTLLAIIDRVSHKNELMTIIKSITAIFDKLINVGDQALKVSINMGISIYPDDSPEISNILKYAEIALNYSKRCYKEKYKFFERLMYEEVTRKAKIEADLINAMYCNEFILYYQPQVDTKTMRMYGVEALLRWNHPEHGVLSPSYFIEIIEQNGMINEIGRFIFREACSQLVLWHKLGYSNLSMSINISEKQLDEISFLDFIDDVLRTTQVEAKYIRIEITERSLVEPTEKIINIVTALREKGIKVIIDDFGTKYSSLNYLYRLPVDGIKIDKSFIDRILDSNREQTILKNIINLAHETNLDVVAEGVESLEQLNCIENINCHNIQGYIFGQPVNSEEFENYLVKYNC